LLIDFDLRKHSLSSLSGDMKYGVSDFLAGHVSDYDSVIIKDIDNNGFDLMPIGTVPPNPSELLSEPRLQMMMTDLKMKYDYIFLDCPPVEVVTDDDIINKYVDATLFVVRCGLLERNMLTFIDSYYRSQRFNNLSVLLNGTDGGGRYGYYYTYGG